MFTLSVSFTQEYAGVWNAVQSSCCQEQLCNYASMFQETERGLVDGVLSVLNYDW
jgi:hypothetical protein